MDPRDDIKARLPIEQLVEQYCPLTRKGRNFVALCPFHNDTHPSLTVSPDKGIAYCFACQSGGDIFSFFQKIENVDFPEALKLLAEKVGVPLPHRAERGGMTGKGEKQRLRECLGAAASFFASRLTETPAALDYVRKRGVSAALIERFQIGYAPDSFSATYEHLLRAGFSRSEILACGLGVQRELAEERVYDRFRGRIMFPIADGYGQIVGFGGRTLLESEAKYVNSPEGPLYHKSAVLFGLHHAKEAVRQRKRVLLVEGYFDVVACHRAGVTNVVAVSGTALTAEHARILKRYAPSVVLCLDQDRAGREAANRAFQLLASSGLAVQSIRIPAKDPDELVARDPSLLMSLLKTEAKPYLDSVLEQLRGHPGITEPRGRVVVAEALFPLLQSIPTAVELEAYLERAANVLGSVKSVVSADFLRWRASDPAPRGKQPHADAAPIPYSRLQLCVGVALVYPAQRSLLKELIPVEDKRWQRVVAMVTGEEHADQLSGAVIEALDCEPALREELHVLALYCEENFGQWSQTLASRELKKLCLGANRDLMARKQEELIGRMKEARRAGRADDETRLLTQYQQVLKLKRMAS